jgi:hypothetical protein
MPSRRLFRLASGKETAVERADDRITTGRDRVGWPGLVRAVLYMGRSVCGIRQS